jgi:6-phosphofructokinase
VQQAVLKLQPIASPSSCFPLPPTLCSYEGRCSLPSNFDATYCNALGHAASSLVAAGQTGVMATVSGGGQAGAGQREEAGWPC